MKAIVVYGRRLSSLFELKYIEIKVYLVVWEVLTVEVPFQ